MVYSHFTNTKKHSYQIKYNQLKQLITKQYNNIFIMYNLNKLQHNPNYKLINVIFKTLLKLKVHVIIHIVQTNKTHKVSYNLTS